MPDKYALARRQLNPINDPIRTVNHEYEIYFAGTDQSGCGLREALRQKIEATPAGGDIDWVTYYFRDRELARQLLRAKQRGVSVRVTLAGKPRSSEANDAVIELLSGVHGLGDGLRLVTPRGLPAPRGRAWGPRLHEKLYCFSHPRPVAFIGSYNPSVDNPELRPDIVAEIGDHQLAYNALVGITEPALVAALAEHARHLNNNYVGLFYRFSGAANRTLEGTGIKLFFWPRIKKHPVMAFLRELPARSRVRLAASHIRSGTAVKLLSGLARAGVDIDVAAADCPRRVPPAVEQALSRARVKMRRVTHPDGRLMHLKFILVEAGNQRWTVFGSFNWTRPSFWLNHEIAAIAADPQLFAAFDRQWRLLVGVPVSRRART